MRIKLNEGIQFQSNVSIAGTPTTTPTQTIAQPQQVWFITLFHIFCISDIYCLLIFRHSKKFNKIIQKKNVANF